MTETSRKDLQNVHSLGKFLSLRFNGNSVRTPLPASKKKITALFQDVKFDILHVQMPYSPLMSARVLSKAPKNVKKFGTFHILPYGFASNYGTKLLGKVMKRSIQSLDHCYAVSQPAKEFMDDAFKVDGTVLPNPIDYKFFHGFSREKKTKKQIVYVGRFEERKGVRELLIAYELLPPAIRNTTKLTMISEGPLLAEVKRKSQDLKLDVHFPGFVTKEEKAQALASADVAVFPSISGESFGIVLTEAMAANSGVTLGGNNPGYASVLSDWPQVLFDPKDTVGFSKKLEYYLLNDEVRKDIGSMQHKAVKQYDIEKVVDCLVKAYKS